MDYIPQLAKVGDVAEAGGKGADLGELARAGTPVPPGFVITTAAYDEFVAAHVWPTGSSSSPPTTPSRSSPPPRT